MERTNTEYLQLIFDEYDIRHDTKIGFDYELDKEITAYDLSIDFAGLTHREQIVVLTEVAVAKSLNKTKQEILNKLFDAHQTIKKINRLKV